MPELQEKMRQIICANQQNITRSFLEVATSKDVMFKIENQSDRFQYLEATIEQNGGLEE